MKTKNMTKSSGQISRRLLILAAIVILGIIITLIVVRRASAPPKPTEPTDGGTPQPVYETAIDDIKFIFQEAKDMGSVLKGSESGQPQWQKDLTTKEKFIKVTITVQNIGKEKINGGWDINEIIDKDGRKFEVEGGETVNWIPADSQCGAVLKPGFAPTTCTKIYEVAAISTDLKVKVSFGEKNGLIDLFIIP